MSMGHIGHTVLGPDEGEVVEGRGTRVVIKVSTADQTVCEYTAPGYFDGPPLHVHPGFRETFIVLDGGLELRAGNEVVQLTPGAVANVSGCVPHTFRNPGPAQTRFLFICTPGGFEHYFRGLAACYAELIAAISERFGYRTVESPELAPLPAG